MLWRCDLMIHRDDDEPMQDAEIKQLCEAVRGIGLTKNALQKEPVILYDNRKMLFHTKSPVQRAELTCWTAALSRRFTDYMFHVSLAECKDPDFELNIRKIMIGDTEYNV